VACLRFRVGLASSSDVPDCRRSAGRGDEEIGRGLATASAKRISDRCCGAGKTSADPDELARAFGHAERPEPLKAVKATREDGEVGV
jgi:hypothetical protein